MYSNLIIKHRFEKSYQFLCPHSNPLTVTKTMNTIHEFTQISVRKTKDENIETTNLGLKLWWLNPSLLCFAFDNQQPYFIISVVLNGFVCNSLLIPS